MSSYIWTWKLKLAQPFWKKYYHYLLTLNIYITWDQQLQNKHLYVSAIE